MIDDVIRERMMIMVDSFEQENALRKFIEDRVRVAEVQEFTPSAYLLKAVRSQVEGLEDVSDRQVLYDLKKLSPSVFAASGTRRFRGKMIAGYYGMRVLV